MASSMTTIATTNVLATTAAVTFAGPVSIAIESPSEKDQVYVYQETGTEGNYQILKDPEKRALIRLDKGKPNFNFEGYGKFKFLLGPETNESLVVGYVAG